ncbi:MAG: hypothetical protein Fur0042_26290 [Cyanophyceae cyanobacterium]
MAIAAGLGGGRDRKAPEGNGQQQKGETDRHGQRGSGACDVYECSLLAWGLRFQNHRDILMTRPQFWVMSIPPDDTPVAGRAGD